MRIALRVPDRSPSLARHGYLFTASLSEPERHDLHRDGAVSIPFLGRRTLVVSGAAGVELFYDESLVQRHRAVPAPIATSLFGPGAIHSLDGEAHRHRKKLFLHALQQTELDRLLAIAERRWGAELEQWRAHGGGEVYSAAVEVYGASIMEWAGIREPESEMRQHARWMAAIVDGFGTVGPAYVKAVRARRRCDAWATRLVREARAARSEFDDSWLAQVASFVDADGEPLPERTAAVELLNILRPTVAVAWLASFAAIALAEQPEWRHRIRQEAGSASKSAEAFAHEVRRYYPFVPVLAGRARHPIEFAGHRLPQGHRLLLDVYGTNHGAEWEDPWAFDPSRFLETDPCDVTHYVPQGGGPRETGHRCPGEGASNGLLELTVRLLADIDTLDLPAQDRHFSMRRMPTRPVSGTKITV
jgi:fatty-acid peroxygenase